jgi:hypothetical protein
MSGEPTRKYQVASHPNSDSRKSRQLCLIMGLLGVLGSLVFALVSHNSGLAPDLQQFPRAIALAETFILKATNWPWGLITCAVLIADVVRLRYEKKAWMVSFILGFLLGSILVQAVRQAAL